MTYPSKTNHILLQRAINLSMALQNISETQHFNNFNVLYVPNPIDESASMQTTSFLNQHHDLSVIQNWVANGGEACVYYLYLRLTEKEDD